MLLETLIKFHTEFTAILVLISLIYHLNAKLTAPVNIMASANSGLTVLRLNSVTRGANSVNVNGRQHCALLARTLLTV